MNTPGYTKLLKMALPLMFGTFVQSIVVVTDAAFLSRIGNIEFDAAGNAGLIYLTFFMLGIGLSDGSQIIIARRMGNGKFREVGIIFRHTCFIALILSSLLFLLHGWGSLHYIPSIVKSDDISDDMITFLQYRSWGVFFAFFMLCFQGFYMGVAKTGVIIFSTLVLAGVNVFLDYTLIFGHFGFEEMGIKGAAIASSFAEMSACIFLLLFTIFKKVNRKYHLFNAFRMNVVLIKNLIQLSFPLMIQGILAMGAWTAFFMMIEQMGELDLAASQVVRSLYFFAFVPIFGLGATTRTYVSKLLGEKRPDEIWPTLKKIILLNLALLFILFHGAFFYPEFIVSIINEDPKVVEIAALILPRVAGAMFLYGIFSMFHQTVSGSGNTQISFYIELISIILYLSLTYYIIIIRNADIATVWLVEYFYFSLIGVFSLLYLLIFDWRNKVI